MKKNSVRLIAASSLAVLLVGALYVGSYAALNNNDAGNANQSASNNVGQAVSIDKAKEIVLAHAGVAPDAAWFGEVDADREKGVLVYELEFYADGIEYEYKVNAASGEVLKSKIDRDDDRKQPDLDSAPSDVAYISLDEAKAIALAHAGVAADVARFEDREFDIDDRKAVYEMEFHANGIEYEYKVDAISGEILKSKQEGKRPAAPAVSVEPKAPVVPAEPEVPAIPEVPEVPAVPEAPAYIGKEQAKSIALAHAGVDADQVRYLENEFDIDDGRAVYELEFRVGAYEYEYEIDALSGKILEFDKEYDD